MGLKKPDKTSGLNKSIFKRLKVYMLLSGILMGSILFVIMLAANPAETENNTLRILLRVSSCVCAGIIIGLINYLLAKSLVTKQLKYINGIAYKANEMKEQINSNEDCFNSLNDYLIELNTDDEFAKTADAFNKMLILFLKMLAVEKAIKNFNELLTSNFDINYITADATEQLLDILECEAGAMLMEIGGKNKVLVDYGFLNADAFLESKEIQNVFISKKYKVVDIPEDININETFIDSSLKYMLIWPILYKDSVLGMLIFAGTKYFDEESIQYVSLFISGLAVALKNALTYNEMHLLATKDPLTGLYNRRFGMERFHEEFMRTTRSGGAIGVLMFDIDNFKSINDRFGHAVGDTVITGIIDVLQDTLRESDFVIRYGGDEFIAVLPDAGREDLYIVAERIRISVYESNIAKREAESLQVSISLGGASYPTTDAATEVELISKADNMLYKAKRGGRNKSFIDKISESPVKF